jgi:uncharacterized protein YdcH (DUF465 family)
MDLKHAPVICTVDQSLIDLNRATMNTAHKEFEMFPEYRDLITQLKTTDKHFKNLFDKHNELDQQIKNLEEHVDHTHARPEQIEGLKKEKLQLKDELYQILRSKA